MNHRDLAYAAHAAAQIGDRTLFTRLSQTLTGEARERWLDAYYALVQLPEPTDADLEPLDTFEPARRKAHAALFGGR